jgi:peroxiredoxin Q/BCP
MGWPSLFNLLSKPLSVGDCAPDFRSRDENGQTVTLSELHGKPVLLVFYPGDDTYGCTRQLCEIRDAWDELKNAGVVVLGVNPQNADSHRRFRKKYDFPFSILVDEGQQVARLYRAGGLIVRRTVVLVGRDGRILLSERGKPSPQRVLAVLDTESVDK